MSCSIDGDGGVTEPDKSDWPLPTTPTSQRRFPLITPKRAKATDDILPVLSHEDEDGIKSCDGFTKGDLEKGLQEEPWSSDDEEASGPVGAVNAWLQDRQNNLTSLYEAALRSKVRMKRSTFAQRVFEYGVYAFLLCLVYFLFVGLPIWNGAVYSLWLAFHSIPEHYPLYVIFIGISAFYTQASFLTRYEPDPEPIRPEDRKAHLERARETALIIPCYKAEILIGATLEAAVKSFPAENIFVIANGKSPTPLDGTLDVCQQYGVNHLWVPIGSKIVAQFVGAQAAQRFKYCLFIDDDCHLPDNFPVVSDRIQAGSKGGETKCIGYTLKSVGEDGGRGTLAQQAQDMEYKLAGMQRQWAGVWGSARFPHGAVALWEREFLLRCFEEHPGYTLSEDWYFGHVCRCLGGRIQMCSSVLVETETPNAFIKGSGNRGGYGEMTVVKQRFHRWNFFIVKRIADNLKSTGLSYRLGRYMPGTVIGVFQEIYELMLYLLSPIMMPIGFAADARFFGIMMVATWGLYVVVGTWFNEVVLRRKKEMVSRKTLYLYYFPYKLALHAITVASLYTSIFKYARYFAKRHPKVVEDERVIELVCKMEGVDITRCVATPATKTNASYTTPQRPRLGHFRVGSAQIRIFGSFNASRSRMSRSNSWLHRSKSQNRSHLGSRSSDGTRRGWMRHEQNPFADEFAFEPRGQLQSSSSQATVSETPSQPTWSRTSSRNRRRLQKRPPKELQISTPSTSMPTLPTPALPSRAWRSTSLDGLEDPFVDAKDWPLRRSNPASDQGGDWPLQAKDWPLPSTSGSQQSFSGLDWPLRPEKARSPLPQIQRSITISDPRTGSYSTNRPKTASSSLSNQSLGGSASPTRSPRRANTVRPGVHSRQSSLQPLNEWSVGPIFLPPREDK